MVVISDTPFFLVLALVHKPSWGAGGIAGTISPPGCGIEMESRLVPFTGQRCVCLTIDGDLSYLRLPHIGSTIGLSSPTPPWFLKIQPYT